MGEKHKGLEVKWGKNKMDGLKKNTRTVTLLFFRHLNCQFLLLPSSAVAGRSHCNRGNGGSAWKDMARPARQHHAVCTLTPVDPSTWVSGTWSHVEQPPAKHKVWVKAIQNWTGLISNETLWSWIHSNNTLTTCQGVPQCPSLLEQSGDLRWKQKKKQKQQVKWCYSLKLNSSPVMSLVPGMMNQGDLVGNRKGLLLSGTQNGATVPWGMPKFTGGTTVAAAASWLSGKAFSGCLGTNGINKNNNINICTHTSTFITHLYIDF